MIYPFCPCAWITISQSIYRAVRAAAAIAEAGLPPTPSPVAPPPAALDDEDVDDWGDLMRASPRTWGCCKTRCTARDHALSPAGNLLAAGASGKAAMPIKQERQGIDEE